MEYSIIDVSNALQSCWNEETSCCGNRIPKDNLARGQCIASSLVIQDYFGGEIIRFAVKAKGINENHYCNILQNQTLIDTTRMQYSKPVIMTPNPITLGNFKDIREKLLADNDILRQYTYLKRRVEDYLSDL